MKTSVTAIQQIKRGGSQQSRQLQTDEGPSSFLQKKLRLGFNKPTLQITIHTIITHKKR